MMLLVGLGDDLPALRALVVVPRAGRLVNAMLAHFDLLTAHGTRLRYGAWLLSSFHIDVWLNSIIKSR